MPLPLRTRRSGRTSPVIVGLSALLGLPLGMLAADAPPSNADGAATPGGGADGGHWNQLRGPDGSAVAEADDLPARWTTGDDGAAPDGRIAWTFETAPAAGASSPLIVGEHVFVTWYDGQRTADGALTTDEQTRPVDLVRTVAKLTLADGKLIWKKEFPAENDPGAYTGHLAVHGYATNTPAYADGRVFVFLGSDGVVGLDAEDGKALWRTSVGTKVGGAGSYTSVTVGEGNVYVNASTESGSLVTLDQRDGKELWRREGLKSCRNTPVVTDDAKGPLVLLSQKDEVLALDAATGEVRWQAPGVEDYVCPSPVADAGHVYAIGGRSNQAFAYPKEAAPDAPATERPVAWRAREGANIPSPIVYEGHLYYVNDRGIVGCIETATGKSVFESRLTPTAGRIYASPIIADGKIYIAAQAGGIYVVAAKPKFEQLAYNPSLDDGEVFATPSAAGRTLLIRSTRAVYAIRDAGGK